MYQARACSSAESPERPSAAMHFRYTHPFAPPPAAPPLATPHLNPVYLQRYNIFDAARFVCDKKLSESQRTKLSDGSRTKPPRYLDAERERQVTRWLLEANEALSQHDRTAKKPGKKKQPFLRRFHSQDSNKNAFKEPWIENFILADPVQPKKGGAFLKRFQPAVEPHSEAGTSRDPSPLSTGERTRAGGTYTLREFCSQHSLPRVVRISGEEQPVLLYRLLERHSTVEALRLSGKKGKVVGRPIMIPEGYTGWFSVSSSRGAALAARRDSVAQLVRARAQTAVCDRPLQAYRPRQETEGGGQYERTAARSGEALRLTAVFADGAKPRAPRYVQMVDQAGTEYFVPINTKGDFYEACHTETLSSEPPPPLDGALPPSSGPTPEEVQFVHRLPHLLSIAGLPLRVKLVSGTVPANMAADFNDDLLLKAVVTEPVVVMYPLPETPSAPASPVRASTEGNKRSIKLPSKSSECLRLVPMSSDIKLSRTQLGYDSEKRMFLSSKLHRALTFCHYNYETWIKQLYYSPSSVLPQNERHKTAEEILSGDELQMKDELAGPKFEKDRRFTLHALKIDPSRLFGKIEKAHKDMPDENEGSIIFLSKNELEVMNYEVYSDVEDPKDEPKHETVNPVNQEQKQFADDKMKVFQEDSAHPKRNKWFKHLKLLRNTEKLTNEKLLAIEKRCNDIQDPFDPESDKHRSIERYQDMAKLIEDKFGNYRKGDGVSDKCHSYKSLASSSDIGFDQDRKKVLTKSVSVQTSMTNAEGKPHIAQNRKNLSMDQINLYGSESSSSMDRQMVSLDENMLKHNNSKPTTSLEKRQRIQPDLIPSVNDSQNFHQIQSCEELNMFLSSDNINNGTDLNFKQNSFITEKLCSEFHVKTKKVLSKSTSNLFHAKKSADTKREKENSNSMPASTEKKNAELKLAQPHSSADNLKEAEGQPVKLKRSISSIQNRKLPVIEDLPYGQVADAVGEFDECLQLEITDNIYAEICNPHISPKIEAPISNPFGDDDYEFGSDILANDPVISNVKEEIRNRNKSVECNENPFRHIEVVVIERNDPQNMDENSISSNEDDFHEYNPFRGDYSEDSWGKTKKSSIESDDKNNHAIRLEITNFPMEHSLGNNDTRNETFSGFDQNCKFDKEIKTEAIYNTLK